MIKRYVNRTSTDLFEFVLFIIGKLMSFGITIQCFEFRDSHYMKKRAGRLNIVNPLLRNGIDFKKTA